METRDLKRAREKWKLTGIKEKVVVNQWKEDRKEEFLVWNLKQRGREREK